ncbi:RNA-dependent RNA polymerase [Hubei rhabdo-like virus 7]|uniref:RNA-directed RNA polymerase L n=1 Tax=Hubei rhabdo-like virus 7 TaxID=1923191 RepID=A0A1L3KN20_9MONO|nr:RNA-dependent RNA polymerase [Hubei rhabdo-like virus 7]APG78729.1 RNA-dependent RNA polymerase [Hubei rhabdo-like virus 7]
MVFLEKPARVRMTNHIEGHLALPIVNTECEMLLSCQSFKCRKHKLLKQVIIQKEKTYGKKIQSIYKSECSPWICLGKTIEKTEVSEVNNKLSTISDVASKILATYIEMTLGVKVDHRKIPKIPVNSELLSLYKKKLQSEKIKEEICYRSIRRGCLIEYNNLLEVEPDIFIHRCEEHNNITLGPTTLLLGKLDLYPTIFNQQLIWTLCDQDELFNEYQIHDYGSRLRQILNKLQYAMGEDFFTVCATVEPLIKGNILARKDDLGFTTLKAECEKKILGFSTDSVGETRYDKRSLPNSGLLQGLISLANEIGENCPLIGFELCGMIKSFGHPVVDDEESLKSLRENACKETEVDKEYAQEIAGTVKQLFMKNYYLKHNHYPKLSTTSQKIKRMVAKNKWDSSMDNLPPQEFNKVTFQKIFDYDYTPDTFQLIKDTAQAPDFENWTSQYDACGFWYQYGIDEYIPPIEHSQRRVVMRYMEGTEKELEQIITDMDNGNYNLARDGIIMLCLKEREMKRIGRMFCKQTYSRRLAQTSMEKNINEKVFKYFPEQTMSQSELDLTKRHASLMKLNYQLAQIVNLDLKKWNLCFRFLLVYFVGAFLDELFGFKSLYALCHLFFTCCFFLTNNRLCPPIKGLDGKPKEGKFCHKNHKGGCEGMHQKLWTLITIGAIQNTAKSCNILVHIMGQGDNIVVILLFKPQQKDKQNELRDMFLKRLKENLAKVNLELKMEETWYSKRVLEYGKRIWYNSKETTNLTKKSRIIPFVNDGFNSHVTNIDTIATGTEALAKGDYTPMRAYTVYVSELLTYLERAKIISLTPKNKNELTAIFFVPKHFGGINISSFFNHMMRGINDQLTMWLYIIRYLKETDNQLYDLVIRKLTTVSNSQRNYLALLEDPFCLNGPSPPSITGQVRSLVKDYIKTVASNPELTQLHAIKNVNAENSIIYDMIHMEPYVPELAAELFSLSLVGYLSKLANRFTSISTLNRVTQNSNSEIINFIDATRENNEQVVEHYRQRFKSRDIKDDLDNVFNEGYCDTQIAKLYRKLHWDLELKHDTKPFFLHQFNIQDYDLVSDDDVPYTIIVSLSKDLANSKNAYHLGEGKFTPYLGSVTQQKTINPHIKMISDNPMIHYIEKLYLYYTWMKLYKCESVADYISKLIKEKLPLIPDENIRANIQEWAPRITGGNPAHRLHSIYAKVGCYINYLFTPTSHISYCTNHLKDLSPKGEDFNIQFQQIFIGFQGSIILHTRFFESRPQSMACTISCRECFEDVSDFKVELPSSTYFDQDLQATLPLLYEIEERQEQKNWLSVRMQLGIYLGVLGGHSYDHDNLAEKTYSYLRRVDYIAEFRSIKFQDYILGLIIQSATLIKNAFDESDYCHLGTPRRGFYTLANLLLTSDRMSEFVRWGDYQASHHSGLLSVDKASIVIHDIVCRYIRKNKATLLKRLFAVKYQDETAAQVYHKLIFYFVSSQKWKELSLIKDKYRTLQQSGLGRGFYITYILVQNSVNGGPSSESEFLLNNPVIRMIARQNDLFGPFIPNDYFDSQQVFNYEIFNPGLYYDTMTSHNVGEPIHCKNIHHLCRNYFSVSSAMSKIIGLINTLDLHLLNPNYVYSLCEGSGSILLLMSHLYPNSLLIFNTLNSDTIDIKHHPGLVEPTAVMAHSCSIEKRIVNVYKLTLGSSDVMTQEFVNKILTNLNKFEGSILTMDPESPNGGSNIEFFEVYHQVYINYFDDKGFQLTKMFYEKYLDKTDIFDKLDNYITLYYIFKPPSSHPNNAEFYLVNSKNPHVSAKIKELKTDTEKCKNYFRKDTQLKTGNFEFFINQCISYRKLHNYKSCLFGRGLSETFDVSACSSVCKKLLKVLLNKYSCCIKELKSFEITRHKQQLIRYNALIVNLKQLVNLLTIEYLLMESRTVIDQVKLAIRIIDKMSEWSYHIQDNWKDVDFFKEKNTIFDYDKNLFKRLKGKCSCGQGLSSRSLRFRLDLSEEVDQHKDLQLLNNVINFFRS